MAKTKEEIKELLSTKLFKNGIANYVHILIKYTEHNLVAVVQRNFMYLRHMI